jgi:DUF1680 family protein
MSLSAIVGVLITLGCVALPVFACALAGAEETARGLRGVPFTQVKVQDRFFAPRIEANRVGTLPVCLEQCEKTGRIRNFAVAAGLEKGKFEGIFFNDSDVYKVIEGASYCLQLHPDPALDARLDQIIKLIAAAQQPDGYLNTYFTLVEPDKRWTNLPKMHELYCAGHLFEGAVAHHAATGKRALLDVAIRFADHIDRTFGEDRLAGVAGHPEIELALVKLYRATGEPRYLKLAQFLIDKKGKGKDYNQDHMPVRQQSEVTGHAVRAVYLYSGMTDVAAITGDQALIAALDRIWRDMTEKKMYITGGIGSSAAGERFTVAYDLPNEAAYCETCAAIGVVLWSHRLLMLHGDAKYADVLERALYNGVLSGVALDGKTFFYVNPLASRGQHHRQPWFSCACCPPNLLRLIASIAGYIYAADESGVRINLYVASTMTADLPHGKVKLTQETDYPWSGDVTVRVEPPAPTKFSLYLRLSGWCDSPSATVNGEAVSMKNVEKGYLRITREWRSGDVVKLRLPMEIKRVVAHPLVKADVGRVALTRGPLVYCLEGVDNGGEVLNLALPDDAPVAAAHQADLLGGVTVLKGKALRARSDDFSERLYAEAKSGEPCAFTAVPYYSWDNREPGEMVVWLPRTVGLTEFKSPPSLAVRGKPSASHVQGTVHALNDRVEPSSSCDLSIPRFTWWDHKGTVEWAALAFDTPVRVSKAEVYWFDDTGKGGCRVPASWRLLYKTGSEWREVTNASPYGVKKDAYNEVTFDCVETREMRIEVQLQPGFSGGVLEWRLW